MIKATLYGHPTGPDAFERHFADTHLPISIKMKGVDKLELTKFLSAAGGAKATYCRMTEVFFAGPSEIQETRISSGDRLHPPAISNFATGGVTVIMVLLQINFQNTFSYESKINKRKFSRRN